MEVITSLDNKRIKEYSKLLQKKYRDLSNYYLVEGEHLVSEAYNNGYLEVEIKTEDYSNNYGKDVIIVTYDVIKKLSNSVNPQKVVGVVRKKKEEEIKGKVLILDNVSDPGNLGTIIRSSVAFNIDTIVLSLDTVDLYNDKVLRATEGMLYNVNIIRKDIDDVINLLHSNGYKVYGTKVDSGINIKKVNKNDKIAVVLGNEGQGIKESILKKCDDYLYIDMNNKCESLNVGVAASIIMYELF